MTSYHFSDLIQSAAIKMGTLALYKPSPVATSGSTTNVTDTSLTLTADELINSLAIVTYDAGGAGAAPEGEFSRVSDNDTTSLTLDTALTVAVAAGDEVMVIRPKYPLAEWRRTANVVLKSFGGIPLWDTSITMTDVTEYTLPAAILEPKEIWRQTDTTTSENEWVLISGWKVQDAVPGTARTLWIPEREAESGYKLGIVYHGDHPTVRARNDHIDVPIELASSKLAWYMINRGGVTDKNRSQAEKILAELNDAERKFRIPNKRAPQPHYLVY